MRLIDADILFEEIKEYIVDPAIAISEHPDDVAQYNAGLLTAMGVVEESCTIDPVKHGQWEDCSNGWMCSVCKHDARKDYPFCPYCGAKMDEV